MGRKRKQTNYRQYYKDYYGIEFGQDMVVHHIDFDRSNNDINNLILLPGKLHSKYHFCLSALGGNKGALTFDCKIRFESTSFERSMLHNLAAALDEIETWKNIKDNADMRLYMEGRNG